jgi:hypothetical protein
MITLPDRSRFALPGAAVSLGVVGTVSAVDLIVIDSLSSPETVFLPAALFGALALMSTLIIGPVRWSDRWFQLPATTFRDTRL